MIGPLLAYALVFGIAVQGTFSHNRSGKPLIGQRVEAKAKTLVQDQDAKKAKCLAETRQEDLDRESKNGGYEIQVEEYCDL